MRGGSWRALAVGLCAVPGWGAGAVDLPRPDEATDLLAPALLAGRHPRWTTSHQAEGAIVGGLLVWPAVTVGPLYDSNPFQQRRPGRGALGIGVAPAALAEVESGPHRTLGYLAGDLRFFPDRSAADVENGRAGILHDWTLGRDLAVRLQGEVARTTDPFDSTRLLAASASPGLIAETDGIAAGSVQKTFDRLFVSASATALRARFDVTGPGRSAVAGAALSSETVLTGSLRVGYLLPSDVFVFAEPAANWRALDRLPEGSTGARAVAGLGVARFGLLSGEVFAGWQEQSYPARPSNLSEPVVGGRVTWSATRAWTATVQVDQSLGTVAVGTAADPLGTPQETLSALATLRCDLFRTWMAQVQAGVVAVDYPGTKRSDPVLGSKLT